MKTIINTATINIKIPIETDQYLREFIFKNINMRRTIWNDFVEEANKYKDEFGNYNGFKPLKFKSEYFKKECSIKRYSEYCVGLSEQVAKDVKNALKTIKTKNKNNFKYYKPGSLKFHKRNNFKGSFRVNCKPSITNNKLSSRVKINSSNNIIFRIRGNYYKMKSEHLFIHLLEPLYEYLENGWYIRRYKESNMKCHECRFREEDIRQISFIHDLGKFYIQLSVNVNYIIDNNEVKSRKEIAGIDTGIHNPLMLYDGEKFISFRMSEKVCNKIHYLERRARRIQGYMDKKYRINKERGENPYSNNYRKLQYKHIKILHKIANIKRDWSFKICKYIVTHYKNIVVDTFEIPKNLDKKLKKETIREFNFLNRFHTMYITNLRLKHLSNKYGTMYYNAPKNTTCVCSSCGFKNNHLELSKRFLTCKKCNKIIDRDENASKNCFDYYHKYVL